MASPTENYIDTTRVSSMSAGIGTGLIFGHKWGSADAGAGVRLTWSAPTGTAYFTNPYSYGNETSTWYTFSGQEITAAAKAIRAWTDVSGVSTSRVGDTKSGVGELRFFKTANSLGLSDGHAYMPADVPRSGDVWMNVNSWNVSGKDAQRLGSYEYYALLHEVGHTLGLKHPFETSLYNSKTLPSRYDNYFYTVMSYATTPWASLVESDFYPTTPMYLDLVAIQHLYGPDTKTRTGNNTYKFAGGQQYWQTIYDAGGTDTIHYTGSTDSTIDLRPGMFSRVTEPVNFSDGSSSRDTVTIGPNVVIEIGVGGSGADRIIGNSANNVLKGGSGSDTLKSGSGHDKLEGGPGDDALYGGVGRDVFVFASPLSDAAGAGNLDRLPDFSVRDDTIRLDDAVFGGLRKGPVRPSALAFGAGAKDGADRIVYDSGTGDLYYDPDGSGAAAQIKFALLPARLKLAADNFFIV